LLGDALTEYRLPSRAWHFALRTGIGLMALLGIVLIALPYLKLGSKLAPAPVLQPEFTITGGVLMLGALAMTVLRRKPGLQVIAQSVTAVLFALILPYCFGAVAPYEDVSCLTQQLLPRFSPNVKIVQYDTFQPAQIFYSGKTITAIHQENSSGYNAKEYENSPLFPAAYSAINGILNTKYQVVVLVRWKQAAQTPALRKLHYWGGNNDCAFLSNKPAPDGLLIEYIAPAKRTERNLYYADAK
jgi:hypothetical protein